MPRPKGSIWKQFLQEFDDAGNVKEVTCKFCTAKYAFPNATRMTRHLTNCEKCPETVKTFLNLKSNNADDSEENIDDDVSVLDNSEVSELSSPPVKKRKQVNIKLFTDTMTATERKKQDKLLARAAFAKGLPLSVYEGKHMQNAFANLRPSYTPPEHHKVGGSLLDEEYEVASLATMEKVRKTECVALMCDGWMNGRSEGLMNFILTTPHPVLIKVVEQGANKEDSDFIAGKMIDVIEEVQQDGNENKVFFILSDNAPVMKAAWRKVQIRYPNIIAFGCGCHGLDLMLKHFVCNGSIGNLYKKARSTVNNIKKKKVVKAHFKQAQKDKYQDNSKALVLPSKTRFFGVYSCLEKLVLNKAALQATVIVEGLDISNTLRSTVLDNDNFWMNTLFLTRMMKPIADGIKIVEANDAKLSHLVAVLMNITVTVNNIVTEDDCPLAVREIQRVSGIVSKFTKFILRDVHLAAYLIDPNFCGKGLGDENKLAATEVIRKMAISLRLDENAVLENLIDFQTRSNFYSNSCLWKGALTLDGLKWWKACCSNQPLYPVASRLMSVPPSATSCERIWSDYEHIHSKKRNKLHNKKTEKLVVVRRYLIDEEMEAKQKNCEALKNRIETLTAYPTIDIVSGEHRLNPVVDDGPFDVEVDANVSDVESLIYSESDCSSEAESD